MMMMPPAPQGPLPPLPTMPGTGGYGMVASSGRWGMPMRSAQGTSAQQSGSEMDSKLQASAPTFVPAVSQESEGNVDKKTSSERS